MNGMNICNIGYYGACNEALMLDALVRDGPLVVNFQVHSDFSTYTGGIYRHTGIKSKYNPFVVSFNIHS